MIRFPAAAVPICLALTLIFIIAAMARAYFSLEEWHYAKTLTLPPSLDQEAVVELVIDREIYAGSAAEREAHSFAVDIRTNRPDVYELADLRLVNGIQQEIPYMLEVLKGQEQRTELPAMLLEESNPTSYMGEGLRFILDLGEEKILHNEIALQIRGQNRKRTLSVEASNDASDWEFVARREIYDYGIDEAAFSTLKTHVRYPDAYQSRKRYIRVTIVSTYEWPLEVLDAAVFRVLRSPTRSASYPTDLLDLQENKKTTVLTLDTRTQGLPHDQVHFEISERNFTRRVNLESSSTRKEWEPLAGGGVISSYDTPQISGRDLAVSYQETANRYLRIIVDNQDSPPLTFAETTVVGDLARMVFLSKPQGEYRIYYGSAGARKPLYDLDRLIPFLLTQELPQAQLGTETLNPYFKPPKPALTERYTWLLPLVVAMMAIFLLGLLLGTIRQARKFLPPPPFSS
jgi:hypothetical protein